MMSLLNYRLFCWVNLQPMKQQAMSICLSRTIARPRTETLPSLWGYSSRLKAEGATRLDTSITLHITEMRS